MNNVTTGVHDPNDAWSCPKCGYMRYQGITHHCPTTIDPNQIHYQQKGVLLENQFISKTKYDIAVLALKEIIRHYGRVCEIFEICRHPGCHSSCDSWLTAHAALEELNEERPDTEPYQYHVCHWHYVEVPAKRFVDGKTSLGVCCVCSGLDCDEYVEKYKDKNDGENRG